MKNYYKILLLAFAINLIMITGVVTNINAATRPATPSRVSVTSTSKSIVKVSIKKVKGVKYNIAYSTSLKQIKKVKNYSDNKVKKVKFANKNKNIFSIKKLNSSKKYYFKVRAFKKVKSKKVYSKWSKLIKIVTDGSKKTISTSNISINTTKIVLYGIDNWADKFLDIPANLNQSYTIKVSGAKDVKYSILSGHAATVNKEGVVSPKFTTFYWQGNIASTTYDPNATSVTKYMTTGKTVIKVVADNKTFNVNVEAKEYSDYYYYAENKMDEYLKKI